MSENEKEETKSKIPKIINIWKITTIILILILFILLGAQLTGMFLSKSYLTSQEAGEKALKYINDNFVKPGTQASLVSVKEMSDIYNVTISYMNRSVPVYITKDGNYLFVYPPFNTAENLQREEEQPPQKFDAPDREKPNVKFFVMSFCPYGNQAENALGPVFKLFKNKVEWEPHYVIYSNYGGYPDYCLDEEEKYCSMHGIQELNEDVRELCIWKYYDHSTWWDFVLQINENCNARNVDTCWVPIAKRLGIDTEKIKNCQKTEAINLLDEEIRLNQKYGVRGSPTVFINDVSYNGARTPEAYKQAICSGFVTEPEECSKTLSTTGSASGQC